jgi:hypothetical protein
MLNLLPFLHSPFQGDDDDGTYPRPWYIGFLYVVSGLCSLGNPLTTAVPATPAGLIVDLYIAFIDVALAGFFIGVFGSLDNLSDLVSSYENKFMWSGKQYPKIALAVFLLFIVPVICISLALVFGALLALSEGWPYSVGFLYVAGNISAQANPLTDESPNAFYVPSVILDLMVSTMALSLAGNGHLAC